MAIEVNNLSFSYGPQIIIDQCSFYVEKGKILALLGRNGSGKSTLMRLLTGSLYPQSGNVRADGINVHQSSRQDLGKLLAYVPQDHNAVFAYTAIDMVIMGRNPHLSIFGRPGPEDYHRAEMALDQVGILHLKDRYYMDMSGGERQLVFLARAIVQEASYYVLDEPTSHLDYYNQHAIMKTLKEIVKLQKCGILIAMHDPNLVLSFADTVVMLQHGRILDMGPVHTTMTSENLSILYDMDLSITSVQEKRLVVSH